MSSDVEVCGDRGVVAVAQYGGVAMVDMCRRGRRYQRPCIEDCAVSRAPSIVLQYRKEGEAGGCGGCGKY